GFVDVLAAGAAGAVGVDAQVGLVDVDGLDFVDFRQHGHRAGRGVDAALRFGFRHALHAVRAGLEFQVAVDAIAFDARDDFLVATVFAGVFAEDFDAPAAAFGVARIHAEQVAGEDRGLVPAGA